MEVKRGDTSLVVVDGYEWFWKMFADGSWEPDTFVIFDKFLNKDEAFLDIGAWIGPTSLYAAPKTKQVFSFEPDPIAYFALIENITLNRLENVIPYPVAVSNAWKALNFGSKNNYGDSMSSELWAKGNTDQVPTVPFLSLVVDIMPGFIKIDIEGGEKNIFDNAALVLGEIKPTIHLSLHTPWHKHDLESYKKHIINGLAEYPFFYDQNLKPTTLEAALDPEAFTAVVASFKEI